jgi:hypothetical protein
MKLANTSASQVEAFLRCPRFWHYGWVKKLKAPPAPAQVRGSAIHEEAEHTQNHDGEVRDTPFAPYVKSMLPYMPIGQERVLTEHKFLLPTAPDLPSWLGFIDLLDDSRTLSLDEFLRVLDYKSTSDFRYAKTPEELKKSTQMCSYARYVFESGHDEEYVEVGHLYIKTAKRTPKKPKCKLVTAKVTREEVNAVWERDLKVVRLTVEAAQEINTDKLPAPDSSDACMKYGGCPHRARCGLTIAASPAGSRFGKTNRKGNAMADSFLDRLQQKAGKKGAPKNNEPETKATVSVLSPDATERTTAAPAAGSAEEMQKSLDETIKKQKEAIKAAQEKEKAAVKKKTTRKTNKKPMLAGTYWNGNEYVEPSSPDWSVSEFERIAGKKKTNGTGFVLYIDCTPVKDVDADVEPTLFEDWISPICMVLNETVQKEKSLPDYRLLPYAEEKAVFAIAVKDGIGDIPSAMVINSGTPGAKDALGVLIPHASKVIRSLRG